MFPLKDIVQNAAMGITPVRHLAQSRHRTGIQSDPARGAALFDQLAGLSPEVLDGLDVLELGPGRGKALMTEAKGRVGSYAAFDVEPYLGPDELADLAVDYRVDPSGHLPWSGGSFDLVWSHSVLEHVRHPASVLDEQWRVLRSGGSLIAEIDLQDHYGDRGDPTSMYQCLKYSPRLWWAMTSHRSSFVNRLRASEWRELFVQRGFRLTSEQTRDCGVPVTAFGGLDYLATISDGDLRTAGITIVATKVG